MERKSFCMCICLCICTCIWRTNNPLYLWYIHLKGNGFWLCPTLDPNLEHILKYASTQYLLHSAGNWNSSFLQLWSFKLFIFHLLCYFQMFIFYIISNYDQLNFLYFIFFIFSNFLSLRGSSPPFGCMSGPNACGTLTEKVLCHKLTNGQRVGRYQHQSI